MRRLMGIPGCIAVLGLSLALAPPAVEATCSPDSVPVGPVCVDKYEASVWSIPAASTRLIKKVQKGKATLAHLTAGGATSLGAATGGCSGSEYPSSFAADGNWTAPLYAASVAGVIPSACLTWHQAEQACRLSGKRLLTNQEWQAAAAGTPGVLDDGSTTCATNSFPPVNTGSRSACVSNWGAMDMVGNVEEFVGIDDGTATATLPQALSHGGTFDDPTATVFLVRTWGLTSTNFGLGFRCAR